MSRLSREWSAGGAVVASLGAALLVWNSLKSLRSSRSVPHLRRQIDALREERDKCRQMERAARQVHERYASLFERSMDCIYLLDFQGRFIDANPAALDLLGFTRDEMHTLKLTDLIGGEQLAKAMRRITEIRSRGFTSEPAEFNLVRRDGREVFVETKASLIMEDGRPVAIQGIARDITARRHAEQLLRESEEKFRNLAESMYAAVGMVRGQRFIYCNRYMAEMLGYTVRELLQKDFPELVHPVHRSMMIDYARRRQMGEHLPGHYPFLAITKSGDLRWVDFSVARAMYQGRPCLVGTGFDITDRVRAEERLRAHSRDLRLLADTATRLLMSDEPRDSLPQIFEELAAHLGLDVYMNYLVADNPRQLRLHAYKGLDESTARQLQVVNFGQTLCGTAALEQRRIVVEHVQKSVEAKVDLVRKLGIRAYACHPLLVNGSLMGTISYMARDRDRFSDEDLELMRAVGHQAAMALEHHRMASQLQRHATELAEANRAKDQFMAVLSHELRTPLAPVLVAASVLEHDPKLPSETREQLEMVRRNVELEARLIDDLLDVTRIVRGKIELAKRPVELGTVLRSAIEVCQEDIKARQLQFRADIAATQSVWILADASRLQQVFWNLLKNAVKFTAPGGRVAINSRLEDGRIVVEVTDSGVGIEPEALRRIFRPFEQAERAVTRRFGGLGLGLTISKAIVELHGGAISAASPGKGQGATFRVVLPVVRMAPGAGVQPAQETSRPSIEAPRVAHARILLVEDHGDTARIIRRLLESRGYRVSIATDVSTALHLAESQPFDLLLSDLGLPDGSGLDLIRRLREQQINLPAIALSGYGQDQDIAQSRAAGFAVHLTKPTPLPQLEETIAGLLASRVL